MSCCRWTMPLGRPVEPDEYIQNAISLRSVSASASSVGKPRSHDSAINALATACPSAAGKRERCTIAAGEIVEEDAAGTVGLRDRKADLAAAGAVPRYLVRTFTRHDLLLAAS